jgi:hypothetical protein
VISGWVYFARSREHSLTKIGFSVQPDIRLQTISAKVPDLEPVRRIATDNPRWLESYFHRAFSAKRQQGEWFSLATDDFSLIANIPDYVSFLGHLHQIPIAIIVLHDSSSAEPRIRVYFDADEELKVALKVAAARQGVSVSALIETLLKREFPKEVEEARKSVRDRDKKPTK